MLAKSEKTIKSLSRAIASDERLEDGNISAKSLNKKV